MSLPEERQLVDRLRALFATRRRDVLLGIGDDAAVVRSGESTVLTTDVLVENEDFTSSSDPRLVGRKALAVSLSDLAAMGATPLHALLTLGLPRDSDPVWFEAFAQGFKSIAVEYAVALVGGDLSASATAFASVTLLGRPPKSGVLTRSGARPGDWVFVSGTLGAAAAGLALLEAGYVLAEGGAVRSPKGRKLAEPRGAEVARLIRHHANPRPMVELGRALAEGPIASSALDLSDGLVRDLHRLCRASGVGAALDQASLPVDSALGDVSGLVNLDPRALALYGGEDFGLLFTVPEKGLRALGKLATHFALRRIGTIETGSEVVLTSAGQRVALRDEGWDHFSSARQDEKA